MSMKKAREYYLNKNINKMNCAQAVIAGFKEPFSFTGDDISKFAGCGGGKAPGGECGALYAAKHILKEHCKEKYDDKVKDIEEKFISAGGSTKCREIRQIRKLPCIGCVEEASKFIESNCAIQNDFNNISVCGSSDCVKNSVRFQGGSGIALKRTAVDTILPKEVSDSIDKNPNIKLLDVRSTFEFNEIHIKNSINIPLEMLGCKIDEFAVPGTAYIVICQTGNRAMMAANMLSESGVSSVKVMSGGISGWNKAKLPVIKGEGGVSLERQIRIIAGSLILFGTVMALLFSRSFLFIPLFVSCGLVYAGVTNNCMMGMLLMKLPYNKRLYMSKPGSGGCSIQ